MRFEIKQYIVTPAVTNNYLVSDPVSGRGLMVDVGEYIPEMSSYIKEHGIRLDLIILTHDHYDHSGGIQALLKEHPVSVMKQDSDWGTTVGDRFVKHGDQFDFCKGVHILFFWRPSIVRVSGSSDGPDAGGPVV